MNLEKINRNMSTETKNKLTPEEVKKLLDLVNILHSAYINLEEKPIMEEENQETVAGSFSRILKDKLPGLELRGEVSEKIEKWKKGKDSGVYSPEEIAQYVTDDIENAAKLYIDSSKHIQMYNRQYIEDKLENNITEIVENENIKVDDLYRVAKIAFDLNGLKTLNDASGHDTGNNALEIFSKLLKDGKTSTWLREQGVEVIPAHQSGDEFILLIYGEKDLSPILEEVRDRYDAEVRAVEASYLLDFQTAKKYLTGLKIYDKFINDLSEKNKTSPEVLEEKFSQEFKFKLGTSVGVVTLAEALFELHPDQIKDVNYRGINRAVIGKMFKIADEKAMEHKKKSKAELINIDPLLAILYNRNVAGSDKDNTEERANLLLKNSELEAEVAELRKKIALLEAQGIAK